MQDYNKDKISRVDSMLQASVSRLKASLLVKPGAHYVAVIFVIAIGFAMHYSTMQTATKKAQNSAVVLGDKPLSANSPLALSKVYAKTVVITHSFYKSANKLGLSNAQRIFVMNLFRHHINYRRDIKPGDTLSVLFVPKNEQNDAIKQGHIVAVDLRLGKRRFLAMSNAVTMPRVFLREEVIQIPFQSEKAHLALSASLMLKQLQHPKNQSTRTIGNNHRG